MESQKLKDVFYIKIYKHNTSKKISHTRPHFRRCITHVDIVTKRREDLFAKAEDMEHDPPHPHTEALLK